MFSKHCRADVVAICLSVHRSVGEVVFPRRVVFAGRLFHNSAIVRRHLSQPQLARSEYITHISYINIFFTLDRLMGGKRCVRVYSFDIREVTC